MNLKLILDTKVYPDCGLGATLSLRLDTALYTVNGGMQRIHVIDSHTGGEPTRIVIAGGPDLGNSSIKERMECFRSRYDYFRSTVVNEPRGSDAVVGALLCEPLDPSCSAAVIFFNNVGYLGMCGHGTIGLGATLSYLGRIKPGMHQVETPVGIVGMELHQSGKVTVNNVESYRSAKRITVKVDGIGEVHGDIAWGGNWFFLCDAPCATKLSNLDELTNYAWRVRCSLTEQGIAGANGGEIDHIELMSEPEDDGNDGRSFVLCPGKEYDRSPCGTGTSAKLACLYADGKMHEGDVWRQESVIGTVFEGSIRVDRGKLYPRITGAAFITADSQLIVQEHDPFRWGIRR